MNFLYTFLCIILHCVPLFAGRSVHRPPDPTLPQINVTWADNPTEIFTLKDSHIEPYPIFKVFDKKHFNAHMLPKKSLSYRYDPQKKVETKILNSLIEELLEEIHQKKRTFTNFTILSAKNFNKKLAVGMMVLKFNDYPFILKLYIETPASFVNPFCKGLDNVWFFPMGRGVNRHLAGFTRIKNLEIIKHRLAKNAKWRESTELPRKWHWLPQEAKWLEIVGFNIGGKKKMKARLPGTYAIIADAIDGKNNLSLFNSDHTSLTMELSNYLDFLIDSHIDNFIIDNNTHKLVLIDTEHFPTVVGIKDKININNYIEWFAYLAGKCAKDWFFRTKKERLLAQLSPHNLALSC